MILRSHFAYLSDPIVFLVNFYRRAICCPPITGYKMCALFYPLWQRLWISQRPMT